jgi:hypothetical protein
MPNATLICNNFLMCGRYRLSRRKQIVEEYFDSAPMEDDWNPRYNIAPTQNVPIIRQNPKEPVREMSLVRWGLIPSWARDSSVSAKMINARSETEREARVPGGPEMSEVPDSRGRVLRVVATRSCMCDCPASTARPDLPSHWQYPTRYGDSVTTRLEALGQCIPPSQDGHRNREGTIFLPASRRIGARVSGRVSRCEPL